MPPRHFTPKDATRREHLARVDRIIHRSASNDFCILSLEDGATALGPADADHFVKGTIFRFLGRWQDDATHGPRFKFDTFIVHRPGGRFGVCKFLTETCDGIGQKAAGRLFDRYGDAAISTLRTEPERVSRECDLNINICTVAAVELETSERFSETKVELFDIFRSHGFGGKLVERAIDKWGAKAPAIIRRNPFSMLGMPSAGFKRCDRLWTELKLPPNAMKRQALCAANVLKNEANGHTWLTATELANKLRELVPNGEPAKAFKFALRARLLKKRRDAANVLWLADYDRATAEERIAASIWRLTHA